MDNVLKVPNYEIESEMVFCNDNLSVKGPVTYCPIYMLMFLKTNALTRIPSINLICKESRKAATGAAHIGGI